MWRPLQEGGDVLSDDIFWVYRKYEILNRYLFYADEILVLYRELGNLIFTFSNIFKQSYPLVSLTNTSGKMDNYWLYFRACGRL